MFRRLLSGVLAATMLFAIACSDSPSDPDPQPVPTSDLKCTAPALASASAKPFDRVEVSGISGLDEAWVEYETVSGTTGLTPVMMNGSGKYEILIPPHPDTLMAGGTLALTVTDGITSCASLEIDVLATDPADGDPVAEALAAFDGLVAEIATLFDLDPALVATTSLDALPAEAVQTVVLN